MWRVKGTGPRDVCQQVIMQQMMQSVRVMGRDHRGRHSVWEGFFAALSASDRRGDAVPRDPLSISARKNGRCDDRSAMLNADLQQH